MTLALTNIIIIKQLVVFCVPVVPQLVPLLVPLSFMSLLCCNFQV